MTTADNSKVTGFTPGPWSVSPYFTRVNEGMILAGGEEIGIFYANDGADEPTDFPAIANASLAAAAPELFEALKLLLADVKDYPAWQRPCHAVDVAEAALSKAVGGDTP